MSKPKIFVIKETLQELKILEKSASSKLISKRMLLMMELKRLEQTGIPKRELARKVGIDHNTAQAWRTKYIKGGIETLLKHGRKGFKPSVFTKQQHDAIEIKLNDPKNGLKGYVELLTWVEKEFNTTFKYGTLIKYTEKNFGSKIKVARKSHVKKDEEAVKTFKKTSDKSVTKP